MTAYLHGHTIRRQMYHGDRWYTIDNLAERFDSTDEAASWIQEHFRQSQRAVAA